MGNIAPMRIVLLALMLAVSHVALISHVTAHFSPQLEQCELCVSQAQLQSAIPCEHNVVSIDTEFNAQLFHRSHQPISANPIIFQRQRAPPVSFS
jgi:hypothetical protein